MEKIVLKIIIYCFPIISYLIGSISAAIIISFVVFRKDIRKLGHGNPGAGNVYRTFGPFWGILVGILDALKMLIVFFIAYKIGLWKAWDTNNDHIIFDIIFSISLISTNVGHQYPIFFGFKGGKGAATMSMIFIMLAPLELFIAQILSLPIVYGLVPANEHRFSRFMPLTFASLTPIVTFIMNQTIKADLGFYHFPHISLTMQIALAVIALSAAFTKPAYFKEQFLKYLHKIPFLYKK